MDISFYILFPWLQTVKKIDPSVIPTNEQELSNKYGKEIIECREYLESRGMIA